MEKIHQKNSGIGPYTDLAPQKLKSDAISVNDVFKGQLLVPFGLSVQWNMFYIHLHTPYR